MAIAGDGSPYRDSYFLVDGHIWSMEGRRQKLTILRLWVGDFVLHQRWLRTLKRHGCTPCPIDLLGVLGITSNHDTTLWGEL